jgi:alpha-ketoglutarate-dependent taurine dioxygenase
MNAPIHVAARPAADIGPEVSCEPYALGEGLPLFITPATAELGGDLDAAIDWLRDRQEAFDQLLCEVGAVVLRDFPFHDTAAFGRAIDHYPDMAFGYLGGATPRQAVQGRVFEATRAPAQAKLTFHQEMSYLPQYPSKLAFFCAHPPDTGGETLIADVRRFDAAMPASFRDQVRQRGVRYTRNFRSPDWSSGDAALDTFHRPWTETFATTDPRQAEAGSEAMGLAWAWDANDSLSVIYTASGFVTHPRTGRDIWFNQIPSQTLNVHNVGPDRMALYDRCYGRETPRPYNTTFGDGGRIDPDDLAPLYPLLTSLEVAFPWRRGDLMLLDNFYVFHGRNPFTGHRDVQVALLG